MHPSELSRPPPLSPSPFLIHSPMPLSRTLARSPSLRCSLATRWGDQRTDRPTDRRAPSPHSLLACLFPIWDLIAETVMPGQRNCKNVRMEHHYIYIQNPQFLATSGSLRGARFLLCPIHARSAHTTPSRGETICTTLSVRMYAPIERTSQKEAGGTS